MRSLDAIFENMVRRSASPLELVALHQEMREHEEFGVFRHFMLKIIAKESVIYSAFDDLHLFLCMATNPAHTWHGWSGNSFERWKEDNLEFAAKLQELKEHRGWPKFEHEIKSIPTTEPLMVALQSVENWEHGIQCGLYTASDLHLAAEAFGYMEPAPREFYDGPVRHRWQTTYSTGAARGPLGDDWTGGLP